MATVEVSPAGTPIAGKTKVGFFAGSLAASGAISLASDIGADGFLNIGFYIPGSLGDWNPAVTQNKLTDQRLSAKVAFESFDVAQWSIPDLLIIEDMQAAGTTTAKGLLLEDTLGTLLVRYGIDAETDWAATQKAWAFGVLLGKRNVVPSTSDAGAKFAYHMAVSFQGPSVEDVAITA